MLYDDTDQRAGAKFAAADLIGIPWQILVGPKGLAEGKLEIKRRSDGSRENLSPAEVVAKLTAMTIRLSTAVPDMLANPATFGPNHGNIEAWMKP